MDFTGRIIQKLDLVEGVSKSGNEWKKQELLLDLVTDNPMYPKRLCITFFGDRTELLSPFDAGMNVVVAADVESREFGGKWYTNVNGYRISAAANVDPTNVAGNPGVAMNDVPTSSGYAPNFGSAATPVSSSDAFGSDVADDLPF